MAIDPKSLLAEVSYKATTSGGKGGQHVNKVATRVELYFDINRSGILDDEARELIIKKLAGRINDEGVLRLTSSEGRSQFSNKELVADKFVELITKALRKEKPRKATKPSESSKEERLHQKKMKSVQKQLRARKFDH